MHVSGALRPVPTPQEWRKLTVAFGDERYPYTFGADCADAIAAEVAAMDADRVFIVADAQVWEQHAPDLAGWSEYQPTTVITIGPGEQAKRAEVLTDVIARAVGAGATRRSIVAAFGGGATGNLAGLAAALLFRGVRLVHLPTTTVGAFDSVFSLKQAINSDHGKNQIGAYHPPSAVLVDSAWFSTLDPAVARGGWCEAAKNALAIDPTSLGAVRAVSQRPASHATWDTLLDLSLRAKTAVMRHDPHERHQGLVLEYGHTVGHAIEYAALRAGRAITHGDAIVLGLIVAARVARAAGHLDAGAVALHEEVAGELGVAAALPDGVAPAAVLDVVRSDNKRGLIRCADDEIAMVLLSELGRPLVSAADNLPLTRVPVSVVAGVLQSLDGRDSER